MVLALVLVGGQHSSNESKASINEPPVSATVGASHIIRDPALLYSAGERVSFMAALDQSARTNGGAADVAEVAAATATPPPEPPAPVPVPKGALIKGQATAYGPAYNGQVLGCGTGYYDSNDMTIMAVGPARYREWPCGTNVQVCGPAGCIVATRQDACPGCYANLVDLSEAGNAAVCGSPPHTCRVTLQVVGGS